MKRYYLDFERKLEPLERRIEEIKKFHDVKEAHYAKEMDGLLKKVSKAEKEIYGDLSNWQRCQLSRHLNRPHTLDYIQNLCTDFIEIHGDRRFRDDPAVVTGFARFNGISVAVVGTPERQHLERDGGEELRHGQPGRVQEVDETDGTGRSMA